MISEVIGMRLKKIREERGYSLEKVSELTGVSKPSKIGRASCRERV